MRWKPVLSHPQLLIPTPTAWLIALMVAGFSPAAWSQVQNLTPVVTTAPVNSVVKTDDPPIYIRAESMDGRPNRYINFDFDVEAIKGAITVNADHGKYTFLEDEVRAIGNVKINRSGDCFAGDSLKMRLDASIGELQNTSYRLVRNDAHGDAKAVLFEGEDQTVLQQATYTTCQAPDPDWYLKGSSLSLDRGMDTGIADGAVVYFKDVPIFTWPSMAFPLSDARHSGFLPPIVGHSSGGGMEMGMPYYWNIAPNRDLTVYPNWYSKRGFQLGGDARYIGEDYRGETTLEYLNDDQQTGTNRYSWSSIQQWKLLPQLSLTWDVNGASDDNYPADFGNSITKTSVRLLNRDVNLTYYGSFWNAGVHVSNFQVLQDPTAPIVKPYARLPELSFNAGQQDIVGFDWSLRSSATDFSAPGLVSGYRVLLQPEVSFPVVTPSYFITPKFAYHLAQYDITDPTTNTRTTPHLYAPTFSLDSGLVFERPSSLFGNAVTQTLEPRLFYVYSPFRQQSSLPAFDTALADFNFAQIFSENRFSGGDLVGDANQITAAIVSRYIESDGEERMKLALAQRFYLNEQQVQLPGSTAAGSSSDILLTADGRITKEWRAEVALQYSQTLHQYTNEQINLQWQPAPMKVLNLAYRLEQGVLKQIDASAQWPIADRWYAVGRSNYSIMDKKVLDALAGVEYKADCWTFRAVAQKYVTTSLSTSTVYFLQLELNGLGKFGPNPLDALKRNVQGYQNINGQ